MKVFGAVAVRDMVGEGGAVCNKDRAGLGIADRGQQRQLAHRQRHVDGVGGVAEASGHAATARLDRFDLQIGDEPEHGFDRAEGVERLLMAMAVDQGAASDFLQRQIEPALRRFAREELLEG